MDYGDLYRTEHANHEATKCILKATEAKLSAARVALEIPPRVFLVVCVDRHADDIITVHLTREGADAEIEAFKADYSRATWTERKHGRGAGWLRYVDAGDDGPSARIETKELQP